MYDETRVIFIAPPPEPAGEGERVPDVVLVSMPFAPRLLPSLGLGLLQAGLEPVGVTCRTVFLGHDFARRVGTRIYDGIADGEPWPLTALAGEWVFADALFPADHERDREYLGAVLPGEFRHARRRLRPGSAARLKAVRAATTAFLDATAAEIAAMAPRVVGFTSVFQQHLASLALARRLRERLPGVYLVLGGANGEGEMGEETLERFPFLDAVVSGEADLLFPDLVRGALAGRPVRGALRAPRLKDLDEIPYPDYTDFLAAYRQSPWRRRQLPNLLFEASRGCWWGEKQHCTFCGLNGASMAFRSKSPARLLAEIDHLHRLLPEAPLQATDNILDMGYFDDVLPALARRRVKLDLFFETKSNLRRDQVAKLRAAGIHGIQPGIESFSDEVLSLMKKGVSGLQNVQLLKWCEEIGVSPYYNLLWGFPGEPREAFARACAWIDLLTHLEPPVGGFPIRLDRFSPNFERAEDLGFLDLQPLPAYGSVYPFGAESLARLAYYFRARRRDGRDAEAEARPLVRAIARWQRVHAASALFHVDTAESTWVFDLRPAASRHVHRLRGLRRRVFAACDAVRERTALARELGEAAPAEAEALRRAGLVLEDGTRFLALPVALGSYAPHGPGLKRFWRVVRALARRESRSWVLPGDDLEARAWLEAAPGKAPRSTRRLPAPPPRPRLRPAQFREQDGDLVVSPHAG